MAFGTMTSRVLGLVRDMAFAAMFSSVVTDAWTVAFRLPNVFRRLLGEGSLSVSFIPVFVEAMANDKTGKRAHNLVNSFYTMLLIVLGVLTALGIFFAEPIIRLMIDEAQFALVPGKFELAVHMAQIMFCFIFLMSTYAFFMGILNALGQFALPAMAPTLFNVAMIVANFVPKEWQVIEGDVLAWAVVVGGVLQTGVLIPALVKAGYFPKLSGLWSNPDVARVWKNMIPGMLGMGLLQITTIINTDFASRFGNGMNSYVYYADRLLELPLSLVSVSLGTALLPMLSRLWTEKKSTEMIASANYYLRLNLFVAIPAAIGLYMLAAPIVTLLFGRGKFLEEGGVPYTAMLVQVYSLTLIASSSVRVLVPSFYAIKNTWFPAAVSGVCLVLHICLAPYLMESRGLQGMVISTLISATLNFVFLKIGFHFLIGSFGLGKFVTSILKFMFPSAVLAGVVSLHPYLFEFLDEKMPSLSLLLSLLVIIPVGAAAFGVASYVFKIEEFHGVWNSLTGKIKRRFGRA